MNDTSDRANSSPRLKAGASSAFCGENPPLFLFRTDVTENDKIKRKIKLFYKTYREPHRNLHP